ncbi:MAG: DUF4384 domain-containing protein [Candidatus Bipolaricaulis anaerobius]
MKSRRWVIVGLAIVSVLGLAQGDPETTFSQILRPGLSLSVDKGCGKTYQYGENLQIRVRSERAGHLAVFHFAADGKVQILFPNQYHTDNRIEGDRDYTIPGTWLPFQFRIGPPAGKELLFGVVTERDQKLVADNYVDFTQVFPALREGWSRSAAEIVRGVSVIPSDMWWGAAMCVFYVETEPVVTPPPPPTTPTTWGMSGRVTTSAGVGIADVTITFTRVSGTGTIPPAVATDGSGNWNQTGFATGTTYRVTPTKSGCTFSPAFLDHSCQSSTMDFTGTCPTTPPVTGNGWALFVGISNYTVHTVTVDGSQGRVNDLSAPASEARAMAEVLKGLFPNQRILTDANATYDAIKRGFSEWLSQAPADATVLFYFCGHGGQQRDVEPDKDEEDGKDETLFATDGKVIVDDEIHVWTTALRAQKVVIIADSCHSGTISRGVFTFQVALSRDLPPALTDGFADDFWKPGQRAPSKVVALSACRPNESTLETTQLTGSWRALFSYYLQEGLQGKADADGDKTVTAQELLAYARTAVAQWLATLPAKDRPAIQPQLHDGLGQAVPLVKLK